METKQGRHKEGGIGEGERGISQERGRDKEGERKGRERKGKRKRERANRARERWERWINQERRSIGDFWMKQWPIVTKLYFLSISLLAIKLWQILPLLVYYLEHSRVSSGAQQSAPLG
jgi:hypothetical protein